MALGAPDAGGPAASLRQARALLIGTATHTPGSLLRDELAVADTLTAFQHTLLRRCGVRESALAVCLDPPTLREFGQALQAVTERADRSDVLLVCYAGHGMVNGSDGQLYLATRESGGEGRLEHTAWPYAHLRRYVLESRARVKIVILDCCFSGRAVNALAADQDEIANAAEIVGTYVLTSAGRDEYALVLPGEQRTAFLGALVDLLEHGDPDAGRALTVASAHRHLARVLPAKGCSRPVGRWLGLAGDLVLAPNQAWRPGGAAAPPRARGAVASSCPYPGLAAFSADDSALFFGRERLTGELVRKIADRYDDPAPVLVMGISGSGKSSLLHAGALPAISRGDLQIAGSATWPRLTFTPTSRPLAKLAANVAPLIGGDPAELEERIRIQPEVLRDELRRSAVGDRVVVVVDQFEELFTQCSGEAERRTFIRALYSAWSGHGGGPVMLVVLGIRADFFGRCAEHAELTRAISGHTMVVGPMTTGEIRQAIERPIESMDLSLEAGLTEVLLTDLGVRRDDDTQPAYEAGRLPLLAHALRSIWQRRDGDVLTVAAYRQIGGIGGALAASAETVLAGLDEHGKNAARDLLLRLVRVGEDTDDTRERASPGELIGGAPDPDAARSVLHALAADDARLVTLDGDSVQITHEALLHSWPTLRFWIDADRTDLRVRQRLTNEARAWERGGRKAGDLAKATSLAIFREWEAEPRRLRVLDDGTRAFAKASIRRARRLQAGVIAALSLVVLLSSVAVLQWQMADERHRIATARKLTAEAEIRRDGDPAEALRLNLAAYEMAGVSGPAHDEARAALAAAVLGDSLTQSFPAHQGAVNAVAFAPGGGTMATGGGDSVVTLWNVRDPLLPRRTAILTGHEGPVTSAEFDARGSLLVTGDGTGRVTLWNTADLQRPRQTAVLQEHGAISAVALGPRSALLATAGRDAKTVLWDVTNPAEPVRLATVSGHGKKISSIAFSPDGTLLATASDDGTVKLWQVSSPTQPNRVATIQKKFFVAERVAFHPSGNELAIAGSCRGSIPVSGPLITLWDVSDKYRPRLKSESNVHPTTVDRLTYNPSGTRLVTASSLDSVVIVWEDPEQNTVFQHSSQVTSLRFSPDGRVLAVGGEDGTLRLRIVTNPAAPRTLFPISGNAPTAFHPDGSIAAAEAAGGGSIELWELRQGSAAARISSFPTDSDVGGLAFSSDGSTLLGLTAGRPAKVIMWDTRIPASPRRMAVMQVGDVTEKSSSVVFHPGRKMIAVVAEDGAVSLWDLRDSARAARLSTLPTAGLNGVAVFDEQGEFLAVGGDDRPPSLWDVRDARDPHRIIWNGAVPASVLAFGGAGSRRLLAAGNGTTVTLWDLSSESVPSRVAALTTVKQVSWLTFHPHGDLLVTGSSERRTTSGHYLPRPIEHDVWGRSDMAEFWVVTDPATPHELPAMASDIEFYPSFAFSADGQQLLTQHKRDTDDVMLWSTTKLNDILAHPHKRACAIAGRGLTQEEWSRYAPEIPYRESCPPAR